MPDDLVKATEHLHWAAVLKSEAQKKLDEAKALIKEAERLGPIAGADALAGATAAQKEARRLRTEGETHQRAALASVSDEKGTA